MKKLSKKLPLINFILIVVIACFVFSLYERDYAVNESDKKSTHKPIRKNLKSIKGIAKIVDGDTVRINKNRIRLVGIDAPESKQKCFDKNNRKYFCGQMSTNFLKRIADKKQIECFYKKKDFYNRYLGNCYLGNKFLNLEMVRNGMAVIYDYKNTDQEFIKAKKSAEEQRLGIWQGAFELPKNYRKRVRR